jgi:hypothetical protein
MVLPALPLTQILTQILIVLLGGGVSLASQRAEGQDTCYERRRPELKRLQSAHEAAADAAHSA